MNRLFRAVAASLLAATSTLAIAAPAQADRYRDGQWHLPFLNVAEAHKISQGEGITVAVIDTGVDAEHPDLSGNVLPGLDVVAGGNGNGWGDRLGHGTGMASLIAGHGHGSGNSEGVLGLAPKAKILPIRINTSADEGQAGNGVAMARGVDEAINRGAKIISISQKSDSAAQDALEKAAAERGVIIVAAAGNRNLENLIIDPAAFEGVVAVGAVGKDGQIADISVRDKKLELAAPGVDIVAANILNNSTGSRYSIGTGTSGATAIVAGVAALVWAKYPQATSKQIIQQLNATAADKGDAGRDDEYGFGVVDPVKALTAPLPTPSTTGAAPSADVSAPHVDASPETKSSNGLLLAIGGVVLLAILIAVILLVARRRSRAS
jgi:type VII secretion-associated serine protease mycosin